MTAGISGVTDSVEHWLAELPVRGYVDLLGRRHFAVVWGDAEAVREPVLTAIHVQDPLRDLLDAGPDRPRAQVERTLGRLTGDGAAVLLLLASPPGAGPDRDSRSQLLSAKLQSHVATAILRDLGIDHVRTG